MEYAKWQQIHIENQNIATRNDSKRQIASYIFDTKKMKLRIGTGTVLTIINLHIVQWFQHNYEDTTVKGNHSVI